MRTVKKMFILFTLVIFACWGAQVSAAPCVGDYDIFEDGYDGDTWTEMTVKQTDWNYARFLILRSEISTCEPGVITAISFNRTQRDDCETVWPDTEVWLRKTTATSLSSNEDPPPVRSTRVYADTWTQTLKGWQTITFNITNFDWDRDNLEIWVKEDNPDTGCCSPYYSTTLVSYMQEGYGESGYYIEDTRRFDIRLTFLSGSPGPTYTPTITPTDTPTPRPTYTPTITPPHTSTPRPTYTPTSTPILSTPTPRPIPVTGYTGVAAIIVFVSTILGIAGFRKLIKY